MLRPVPHPHLRIIPKRWSTAFIRDMELQLEALPCQFKIMPVGPLPLPSVVCPKQGKYVMRHGGLSMANNAKTSSYVQSGKKCFDDKLKYFFSNEATRTWNFHLLLVLNEDSLPSFCLWKFRSRSSESGPRYFLLGYHTIIWEEIEPRCGTNYTPSDLGWIKFTNRTDTTKYHI